MIFEHKKAQKMKRQFVFDGALTATAHNSLLKPIFKELWNNFSFKKSEINLSKADDLVFIIGDAELIPTAGEDYSINVTETGISIYAESEKNLILGFMSLIDMIKSTEDGRCKIECISLSESALIKLRMAHFCVFPETELWEIQKFIRYSAALKYTHIIIEFWGMFKYSCLDSLSWNHAFTKEELEPIFKEARDMGLEMIPMFNCWGHATASRMTHGKHVVLDQDPTLAHYFDETGWRWNIADDKVKKLIKTIIKELTDLCGNGEYFHIGCDEAYGFGFTEPEMKELCDYINETSEYLKNIGRKTIMWGDMLVTKHDNFDPDVWYFAHCPNEEAERFMTSHISKDIILADWQYSVKRAPIETAVVLKNAGYSVLVCPWNEIPAVDASVDTAINEGLLGILQTTWHTLSIDMPFVARCAVASFDGIERYKNLPTVLDNELRWVKPAEVMRRAYPAGGEYRKAGWSKIEISELTP